MLLATTVVVDGFVCISRIAIARLRCFFRILIHREDKGNSHTKAFPAILRCLLFISEKHGKAFIAILQKIFASLSVESIS